MGRCGHPTTLEQRSKIFRYAFFYSEIADLATSSLEYIKECFVRN